MCCMVHNVYICAGGVYNGPFAPGLQIDCVALSDICSLRRLSILTGQFLANDDVLISFLAKENVFEHKSFDGLVSVLNKHLGCL